MNKSAYWAWAIKNSICVICWVVLAIVFNKWWIALFAALFVSSLEASKPVGIHYRVCDRCGIRSPYADSYNGALDKARENGWIHYVAENKDYCPNCQKINEDFKRW